MRFITILCLLPTLAVQGCVTQNQGTKVAEQVAADNSKDDATCRQQSGTDKAAYEACRNRLAEARGQQDAIQEQRRRDFDRLLGAGTRGDGNN